MLYPKLIPRRLKLKLSNKNSYKLILDAYKYVLRIISVFLCFASILIVLFSRFNSSTMHSITAHSLAVVVLLTAIGMFGCSYSNRYIKYLMMILPVAIGIIGAFPNLNLYLFYTLPLILSLYTFNKHIIKTTAILGAISFLASVSFKTYLNLNTLNKVVSSSSKIGIVLLLAFFEVVVIVIASVPIFLYLIDANHWQYVAIKEKKSAKKDILDFCSAVSIYHNRYLEAHINGVREITKVILDGLIEDGEHVNPYYYDQIIFSVQFHDIGKTYIPPAILDKPGPLTTEEFELIKEHPQKGLELIELLPKNAMDSHTFDVCKNVIYQHHERRDGSGYPQGLLGDDIRFEAQIVAVADVVDALLAWRPYKAPMTFETMQKTLLKNSERYHKQCLNIVFRNKDKIIEISEKNNRHLQEVLNLDAADLIRV